MNPQPDVMTLLESARPSQLDPAPDSRRRQYDLARALGQAQLPAGTDRASVFRPARIAFGLTAAAAVVAVAVVTATGSATPAGPPATAARGGSAAPQAPRSVTLSASQILLAAADQVRTTATTGRYWRTTTDLYGLELAGPAKDPYVVRSGDREQDWVARSASDISLGAGRGLGLRPATAADRAAWKRDGSPSTYAVHGNWVDPKKNVPKDKIPDSVATIPGAPSKWTVDRYNPDDKDKVFFVGHALSMHEVLALPSDQQALRTFLLTDYQRNVKADATQRRLKGEGPGEPGSVPTKDQFLFQTATDLLTLPVAPEVRASAYRIMAGLQGVTSFGQVKDVAGQVGDAVAVQGSDSRGVYQYRLIIDPKTGLMLADETRILKPTRELSWLKPTDVYAATVIRSIGWTNDTPPAVTPYVPSGHGVG